MYRIFNTLLNIIEGLFNLIRFKLFKSYRSKQLELFDSRLNVCNDCDNLNKSFRQCNLCGCFVDAKTKVIYKNDDDGLAISYIDPITGEIFYACPEKYW